MKLIIALIIASICLNVCCGATLSEKAKQMGSDIKDSFKKLGDKLKVVGGALKDVAVDQAKGLASQALQAIAGAFLESFKPFDLGKLIFGKRESGEVELASIVSSVFEETKMILEAIFHKTFARFADVLQNLKNYPSVEDVQAELTDIHDDHKLAVRGIVGDSLNAVIDTMRKLYYESKATLSALLGSKQSEVADPVMVGRRGLVADAWNTFNSKLEALKQKIAPEVEKVSEIASNVAATLKHHTGKMFEEVKDNAVSKVEQALGYLSDELETHI